MGDFGINWCIFTKNWYQGW